MAPPSTMPATTTTDAATSEGGGGEAFDRRRPLFDGALPVEVVSSGASGASSREGQQLTVRVLRGARGQHGGERVLRLEVTTDASVGAMASFLYALEVGERDFPELKRDQSLLVDFEAFPAKLVETIQGCCPGPGPSLPADGGDQGEEKPRFRTRLDTTMGSSGAVLSIVEATPFKELTHLALRVRPAHDGALKAYLASRLRHTLQLAEERRQGQADAEARFARSEERARALEAAAAETAAAHAEEMKGLKQAHEGQMAATRERQEGELRALREERDKAVGSLQRRLEETERRRVELAEQKRAQDGDVRQLSRQVQTLQAAADGFKAEAGRLAGEVGRLEGEVAALKGERAELQRAEGALRQRVADVEEGLKGARAGQEAARAGQARAEEALALYKGNALQLQKRLEGSVEEIQRGNQIIAKLQAEGARARDKLRVKGEVLKQQERLLQERQRALDEARHRLEGSTREGERLRGELAATGARLEEASRLNESNQQVITWLNKEINDLQLGRGSGLLPLPGVGAYGGGSSAKQNLSLASGSSAATYTPAYGGRYSTGVHDTTASTISAASSAYILSPVTPATTAATTKGGAKKGGSAKKNKAAAAVAAAASPSAAGGAMTGNNSSSSGGKASKKGPEAAVSTIYLDALGLADSTGSLSPLVPGATAAH